MMAKRFLTKTFRFVSCLLLGASPGCEYQLRRAETKGAFYDKLFAGDAKAWFIFIGILVLVSLIWVVSALRSRWQKGNQTPEDEKN